MAGNVIFPFVLQDEGERMIEDIVLEKLNEMAEAVKVSAITVPMTPKEVAAYFNVTQPTIDKWVKDGMPKHKYGSVVRYYKDEVDTWFKQRGS